MKNLEIYYNNPNTDERKLIEKWELINGVAKLVFSKNNEHIHSSIENYEPKHGEIYLEHLFNKVNKSSFLEAVKN